MVVPTCNPSTEGLKGGGSEAQVHPGLHRKFEASFEPCLSTSTPPLEKKEKMKENQTSWQHVSEE